MDNVYGLWTVDYGLGFTMNNGTLNNGRRLWTGDHGLI